MPSISSRRYDDLRIYKPYGWNRSGRAYTCFAVLRHILGGHPSCDFFDRFACAVTPTGKTFETFTLAELLAGAYALVSRSFDRTGKTTGVVLWPQRGISASCGGGGGHERDRLRTDIQWFVSLPVGIPQTAQHRNLPHALWHIILCFGRAFRSAI